MNTPETPQSPAQGAAHPLDALTGGAFSAPTSGERAARVRDWLASEPSQEQMNEVFKELSHRDRGAAKALKEKLDELKRQKSQEQIADDWAQKAQTLLDHNRMNLADALAWQRDAARAGAPLSREPLSGLKQALAERVKAIEELQHRAHVEREASVLLAQRIEVLSTKPWRDAQRNIEGLRNDVQHWTQQVDALQSDVQWNSVEAKFPPMLETSRQQLQLVWEAFEAALTQAVAAEANPQAPLPAVPVWADELRVARGLPAAAAAEKAEQNAQATQQKRARVAADLGKALDILERELAEGHGKATPKAAADVRAVLKSHGRLVSPELEARAHAALSQAGELEGWQRWRADQLREELVDKAEGLLKAPEGQQLGGRKMQETLRGLREQWKTTDQGGQSNHALWKRFDEACNEAHKVVEVWLTQVRHQADAHKAQRLATIEELKAWTEAHADNSDWKNQIRELHAFSERWRQAGHLSEKAFADIQPQWKDAMHLAHARLEVAQKESTELRRALIDEAQTLGAAAQLRIDAVKDLQQRWQAEAHAVPLERKHEQKLWESFRQPIDEAFARKSSEREKASKALNAHDQHVLDASRAVEAASASGDAQRIREAMAALESALAGRPEASPAPAVVPKAASADADKTAAPAPEQDPQLAAASDETSAVGEAGAESDASSQPAPPSPPPAPPRKVVAVRGDDRPGMKKAEPAGRDARRGERPGGRGGRDDRGAGASFPRREQRDDWAPRGPRLGDAAFRAQRQAVDTAEASLRKLAAQAHGEVLTQLMSAWEQRDPEQLPSAQVLGSRVTASDRGTWVQALAPSQGSSVGDALLRLEMAAEMPTPAEHLSERRMLQLQLLTNRKDAGPAQTWSEDVARVLGAPYDAGAARRLQGVLKVLLKR